MPRTRSSVMVAALAASLAVPALARAADPEKARRKLEQGRHELTVDAFMTQVFLGDAKLVQLYLDAGMEVDAVGANGDRPLHLAARRGNEKMVALLLAANASPDVRTPKDETPLCAAAAHGSARCLGLLVKEGADVNLACGSGRTALIEAARAGDAAGVELLLAAHADPSPRDSRGHTALHAAAEKSPAAVSALLRAGADKTARGNDGTTPLHAAADAEQIESLRLLLEAGADPNVRDGEGRTPLYQAARFGHVGSLAPLLAAGADPKARARDGSTPLTAARDAKRVEALALLEQAPTVAVRAQPTPAPMATSGDPVGALKQMGILTVDGKTLFKRLDACDVQAVSLLLASGVKTSVRNNVGRPPLHVAIEKGDLAMVQALLAAGANPADYGSHVRPELESHSDNVMLAVDRGDPEILKALLDTGVDPNHPNDWGGSALASAATSKRADLMRILLAAKADPNLVEPKYHTPVLAAAVAQGDLETVRVLIDAGAKVAPYRQMLLETVAHREEPEIRALILKAAGGGAVPPGRPSPPKPSAASTRPRPPARPATQGLMTAKQAYELLLPQARAWQEDAELTNLTTTTEGRLQDDGRSSHWVFHFVSRSAVQTNIMRVSAGSVSSTLVPAPSPRVLRIGPGTRLDTQELNAIANEAGAREYTGRATRPMVGLQSNRERALWYFNYDDKASGRNILTIVIDADSGAIVLKDGK